jgi:hypothetical protein
LERLPAAAVLVFLFLARCSALDRSAFTFTKYDLTVRVEPEQQRFAARGTLTLRNDSQVAQKNAVLQISSSLDWRSIQANGRQVQFVAQTYTSDIDHTGALSEAVLTFAEEIKPGAQVELEIGYEGVIPLDVSRLTRIGTPEDVARRTDWDQIGLKSSAVRGVGYAVWYPVSIPSGNLSESDTVFEVLGAWKAREAAASMKLSFSLSRNQAGSASVLLCNAEHGLPQNSQHGDDFVQTDCLYSPLGLTVPAFVVGSYQLDQSEVLNVWTWPEHKQKADAYLAAANRVLPLVKQWFGTPKRRAEVIELPEDDAAPFESGSVLFTPLSADTQLAELTLVHEVTHAAFPSPRLWIAEGAAHFAQALYREQKAGRQAALDYMGLHRAAVAQAEKSLAPATRADDSSHRSLVSTTEEEFYRSKAMFVFWMLRDMVGNDLLTKAILTYKAKEDKEPSYFQRLISTQNNRDLEWFFDDWVYRDRGLPDFRVESAYPRQTVLGGFVVTVTVENLGLAGAEVPVTVRVAEGDIIKRLEVRGKAKASIRIEVPGVPLEVVVNDGSVPESDLANNTLKLQAAPKPE